MCSPCNQVRQRANTEKKGNKKKGGKKKGNKKKGEYKVRPYGVMIAFGNIEKLSVFSSSSNQFAGFAMM